MKCSRSIDGVCIIREARDCPETGMWFCEYRTHTGEWSVSTGPSEGLKRALGKGVPLGREPKDLGKAALFGLGEIRLASGGVMILRLTAAEIDQWLADH